MDDLRIVIEPSQYMADECAKIEAEAKAFGQKWTRVVLAVGISGFLIQAGIAALLWAR